MNRRSFLTLLGAALVSPSIPRKVYCFAPVGGWHQLDSGVWRYRYTYRSSITGCSSNPLPIDMWTNTLTVQDVDNSRFGLHIYYDLIDIYRRIPGSDEYMYMETYDRKTA